MTEDAIKHFISALIRALPRQLQATARAELPAMERDFRSTFPSFGFKPDAGRRLGQTFSAATRLPTFFELSQALRSEISAESGKSGRVGCSETDTWINYLRDRFSLLPPGPARDDAKSLFLAKANPEAKAAVLGLFPQDFPRDQAEREWEEFWWDRLDRIFALEWINYQVGEAKDLLERIERGAIKTAPIFVAPRLRDFLAEHDDVEPFSLPRLAGLGRAQTDDDEASPQPPIPVYPTPTQAAPPPKGPSKASARVMGEVRGSRARPSQPKLSPEALAARQAREELLARDRQPARERLMAIPVPRMPG